MGRRTKARASAKAGKRDRTKDLTARDIGRVKGGRYSEFSFVKRNDKASTTLG
jgi:hypothetical protein